MAETSRATMANENVQDVMYVLNQGARNLRMRLPGTTQRIAFENGVYKPNDGREMKALDKALENPRNQMLFRKVDKKDAIALSLAHQGMISQRMAERGVSGSVSTAIAQAQLNKRDAEFKAMGLGDEETRKLVEQYREQGLELTMPSGVQREEIADVESDPTKRVGDSTGLPPVPTSSSGQAPVASGDSIRRVAETTDSREGNNKTVETTIRQEPQENLAGITDRGVRSIGVEADKELQEANAEDQKRREEENQRRLAMTEEQRRKEDEDKRLQEQQQQAADSAAAAKRDEELRGTAQTATAKSTFKFMKPDGQ